MSSQNPQSDGPSAADLAAAEAMMAGGDVSMAEGPARDVNLDVILDVPVTLSLEVGRTRLPIRSLLQLNQGSVVELERAAGEPLDVFVNGTLVAHGEVVVVNDKFGIRLIDVVSPAERIRKLK
jgi:flagellar motor switch protein FliN/FliY